MRRQVNEMAGLGKSLFLSDTISHIYHHYLSFATSLSHVPVRRRPIYGQYVFQEGVFAYSRPGWTLVHYAHCPRGLGVFFLECYS
jgi:hypothetical protein